MSFLVAAAVAVVAGQAVSTYATIQAGTEAEKAARVRARELKLQNKMDEADRRAEVNRLLARNINSQAAGGILGEGTPASVSLTTAEDLSTSEAGASLTARLQIAQVERQGAQAKKQGYLNATSSLLKAAPELASAAKTISA